MTFHAHFDALRKRLHGRLALPGEPEYRDTSPLNQAVTTGPAAVILAADADDVRLTAQWAAACGLRIAVHATGHGGVSHGSDVIVIHTGLLQQCSIDVGRRTARVGAGVLAQRLLDAAHDVGLAPVLGSTATVGIVGYLSGGGIGPLVSTLGLSSDYVRALEVVTGDGMLHRATPEQDADLYWAARGGKAALGIIIAAELELIELPTIYGGTMHYAADDAADVVHEWARWSAQLPEVATTSLVLTNFPDLPTVPSVLAGKFIASLRYATTADAAEGDALLHPIRGVATPVVDTIRSMPLRELGSAVSSPSGPIAIHQDQVLLSSLTPETVDAILHHVGPDSGSAVTEVEVRRLGGALVREPRHPSAFSHRASPYSLSVTGVLADDAARVIATARRLFTAVQPWSSDTTLANFVDTTDPTEVSRAYDAATLLRMRSIAARYDPAGVFAVAGELTLDRRG